MMRTFIGFVAWMLAMALAADTLTASAAALPGWDGDMRAAPVEQRQSTACDQTISSPTWTEARVRVAFEELGVGPAGAFGIPRLCVLHFETEDVHSFLLSGIESVGQFRAAKAESITRLRERGFDLCRAQKWDVWGRPNQAGFSYDDYYNVGSPCSPRVRAGDDGAVAHLPSVKAVLDRVVEETAADLGDRPDRPLEILVYTQRHAATAAFVRYSPAFADAGQAERAVQLGETLGLRGLGSRFVYGNLIVLNLTDPNYLSNPKIELDIVNRYTFFALNALVGTDVSNESGGDTSALPTWFITGLQHRQLNRRAVGGSNGGYLVEAARAAREGQIPPLDALQTGAQARTTIQQFGGYVVLARSYALVTYLYEKHGTDAVASVLRQNHDGSIGRFNDLVKELTGLDSAGLDREVTSWLLGLRTIRGASPDGQLTVEITLLEDSLRGEALVEEAAAACLFDVKSPSPQRAPGLVGFSLGIGADGAFTVTRPSSRAGNAVSMQGRIDAAGTVAGAYRVTNEVTNCDSGQVRFGPAS